MILYRPTDSDITHARINYRPRTCFIMTQLGKPIPKEIIDIRKNLTALIAKYDIKEIDAGSKVTGRDFLLKIWEMIISVPLGIAIIHENMTAQTLSNIFYEIGMLQAYGKETLVIKTKKSKVPSDFIRTEYIEYSEDFNRKINSFLDYFFEMPIFFETASEQVEKNPLLTIDYLRRAFLITGNEEYRLKAKEVFKNSGIIGRAKNSVEMLLVDF